MVEQGGQVQVVGTWAFLVAVAMGVTVEAKAVVEMPSAFRVVVMD